MPNYFYELSIYTTFALVFIVCNLISGVGFYVSHRFLSRIDNKEMVTKVVWQTVLFFTTMFITFWIATNWSNLGQLKQTTVKEANSIELLYYDLDLLKSPDHKFSQLKLHNYLDLIVNEEYKSLSTGHDSISTESAYQDLLHLIYKYNPINTSDEQSYDRVLNQLNQMSSLRDSRLQFLDGNLQGPLLLFFVIMIVVGCFWTGFIHTRSKLFSLFIILCQNLIISSSCWLILEMDKPFQGQISIDKSAFVAVQQQIHKFTTTAK